MTLLKAEGLSKLHDNLHVVRNVSLQQTPLQKLGIAGETGSGKSTLLKILAGLIQPDAGVVLLNGQKVLGPEEQLLPGHAAIGYLSQHFELRNNYRVEELLEMALQIDPAEANRIYTICRIEHLLKRRTNQLSGGEKQRIATARLLIAEPKLLILDEPFSNLDVAHKNILKQVIRDVTDTLEITCILVSHDPADLLSWADHIVVMHQGQIVQEGTPQHLYKNPNDAYVAGLFGGYNQPSQALFSALTRHLQLVDQSMEIIRPEDLTLSSIMDDGLPARVVNVLYMGSYYHVELLVMDEQLLALVHHQPPTVGALVYVSSRASNL